MYTLPTNANVQANGVYVNRISRDLAMSVPAVQRGVTLKVTTMASLPLERVDGLGNRVDLGWLSQPETGRSRYATFCDLGLDLELEGEGYLFVKDRETSGQPKIGGCEYVPLNEITKEIGRDGKTDIRINGDAVPRDRVVGFPGWHNGILIHGARIIRTAIALEAASQRYADSPMPSERLINTSEYELSDTEIDDLLLSYQAARNSSSVAYVNAGLKPDVIGFDPAQLQLVEARQYTSTQIANLVGVPAHYIAGAAASSGGSVTYANVTQDARALIDYGMKPMLRAIESRLSLSDVTGEAWSYQVTPRGTVVRFNLDALLRGNPMERAQLYQILIPLGVITVEEARQMEDLAPAGRPQA